MDVIRSLDVRPSPAVPAAVAIGNFDGVHLGHRHILSFLVDQARREELLSLVLTFSPHPGKVTGGGRIQLLQTEPQKLRRIESLEVEAVYLLPFDRKLSRLSPELFIRDIIIQRLNAHVIVVGENFRFGLQRAGTVSVLLDLARKYALTLYPISPLIREGEVVSSSLIRDCIRRGEVEKAQRLLGDPYMIEGRVVAGQNLGRGLGFPTANLDTTNEILPPGVFVTTAKALGRAMPSVTNVGTRPTFGQDRLRIETHILDYTRDLYGSSLSLLFHQKIRAEKRFDSAAELKARIQKDLAVARRYFERHGQPDGT